MVDFPENSSTDLSKIDLKELEHEIHLYELKILAKQKEIAQLKKQFRTSEMRNVDGPKEHQNSVQSNSRTQPAKISKTIIRFQRVSRVSKVIKKPSGLDEKLQRILKVVKNK